MTHTLKKLILAALLITTISAQAWEPKKPITVILPNAPGAGNEIAFRTLAKQVEFKTGVNFIYEHRPGADGTIAMNHLYTLPADGYSIGVPSCQGTWVTAEIWYSQNVKFDPMNFLPITNIGKSPLAFYAKTTTSIDTPEKLISEIKSARRPINFAVGGSAHKLAVKYFVNSINPAKDTTESIMYKGPAQAMQDVLSGIVEFGVFPIAVGAPMVKAGKLKLIGVASETVLPGLENYKLMHKYVPGLNVYA